MNPKFGFTTATYGTTAINIDGYHYIKPGTAIELYLTDGVWHN